MLSLLSLNGFYFGTAKLLKIYEIVKSNWKLKVFDYLRTRNKIVNFAA